MENLNNMFESLGDEEINFEDDNIQDITAPTENRQEENEETDISSIFDDFEKSDEGEENISVVDKFLRSKGFTNSEITIVNENNEEESVNINSLSHEEQLDILNSLTTEEKDNQLSQNESEWLKELRSNNLDFDGFLELYKNSIIEELGGTTESYEIDAYDDKELFLLDLKNKYELTDEELSQELEKELGNEELFAKKVNKLREEYKSLEAQEKQNQEEQQTQQKDQEYQGYINQMVGIAQNVQEFHGLELEDDDKNKILSYMLDLDDNGISQVSRDLNDPKKLYEVAWYLQYGKDAFKIIENAYESEISRMKAQRDKPSVIRQNTQSDRIKNINELY